MENGEWRICLSVCVATCLVVLFFCFLFFFGVVWMWGGLQPLGFEELDGHKIAGHATTLCGSYPTFQSFRKSPGEHATAEFS